MIRFRPFRNDDPPTIARLWHEHGSVGLGPGEVTPNVLEEHVFSKLYFLRSSLIMAIDEQEQAIGFAHAGFGPNEDRSSVGRTWGVVSNLVVGNCPQRTRIGVGLVAQCEDYLSKAGATSIVAMGTHELCPFYFGLYGGSQVPGILSTDQFRTEVFRTANFLEIGRYSVQQIDPAAFRPITDRNTIQWRRQYKLDSAVVETLSNWWEACLFANCHRVRYWLADTNGQSLAASAVAWDMHPIAAATKTTSRGILALSSDSDSVSDELLTFLASELIRRLGSEYVKLVEAQFLTSDQSLASTYKRLGFREVNQGIVLEKKVK